MGIIMKFLRNPEIQREFLAAIFLLAAAGLVAVYLVGTPGVACVLLTGVVFVSLRFLSAFLRYRKIAWMSKNLDEILHDDSVALLQ